MQTVGRSVPAGGDVTHPGDATADYGPLYAQYRALYPALASHLAATETG